MTRRLRYPAALLPPVWHALPWRPLAAAGALGWLPVAAARPLSGGTGDTALGLSLLRLAALVAGVGLAFLLDDPARRTTEAVPVRRPVRAGLRLALVAPPLAAWWTAALLLLPAGSRPPSGAVSLEAAGIAGTALALAAASVRLRAEPCPGTGAARGLLALTAAVLLLPDRWSPLVSLQDANWTAAHGWWAAILVVAALVWAVCVPEPLTGHRLLAGRAVRSPCGTSGPSRRS
ncbi:ABC transporter [Streptomyces naganishii]|uniref:ABC transporter n=1 Tax=Streptomyces naganishii JCM 4654 TaxID=1306179 RepID=A0A918YC18_9ACTN|nr:ABC transporter [Streptomyces naganishii]GHD96723.1 ABC transporter [Streptomyces naganishii JCM 4654]